MSTMFFLKQRWFVFAAFFLVLSVLYTAIFATGVFLYPMLHIEQLLLLRPITRVDCVLDQWSRIGEVDVTLVLALVLAGVCMLLGYRKRVLPYILLLFLVGASVEVLGKYTLPQQIPHPVQQGLNVLHCNSLEGQPRLTHYFVALGAWWVAPPVSQVSIQQAQLGATTPLVSDVPVDLMYGYPSGHAMRWAFLGLLACWLSIQHVRRPLLRRILIVLTSVVAFGGGFAQFYIGNHYITDIIIGYLLGISSACCMIGLLIRNRKNVPRRVTNKFL